MLTPRPSADRGHFDHGWLVTYHSFSFAGYHDPRHMGYRSLRVINEDRVEPARGFGTHPHQDMEILTYVISGALEHKDSMGNHSVIRQGEIQVMSAGTGIQHSEVNPSSSESVHLLQIWILPDRKGLPPRYDQKFIPATRPSVTIADQEGAGDAVKIHQDVRVNLLRLDGGQQVLLDSTPLRHGWLQVVSGDLEVTTKAAELHRLVAGDGAAVAEEPRVTMQARTDATVLWFDLA